MGQRDVIERIENKSFNNTQNFSLSNAGDKKNDSGNSRLNLGDQASLNNTNTLSPELQLARSILLYDPNAVAPRRG